MTVDRGIFSASTDASNRNGLTLQEEERLLFDYEIGGTRYLIRTTPYYRDTASWYHVVLAIDTTQATEENRVKIYVNGSEQTVSEVTNGYPDQNVEMFINNNIEHHIGRQSWDSSAQFDGYLTDINFVDGQSLDASYFGYTDSQTGQ